MIEVENKFYLCCITLNDAGSTYFYLTHDASLKVGEEVFVPVGKNNVHKIGCIKKLDYVTEAELPMQFDKLKVVLCRSNENPNHRPSSYYHSEKYFLAVYRNTHKREIYETIAKLLESNSCFMTYYYETLVAASIIKQIKASTCSLGKCHQANYRTTIKEWLFYFQINLEIFNI